MKLKPCPFCGGEGYRDEFETIRCSSADCPLFYGNGFNKELGENWNHRPTESALAEALDSAIRIIEITAAKYKTVEKASAEPLAAYRAVLNSALAPTEGM